MKGLRKIVLLFLTVSFCLFQGQLTYVDASEGVEWGYEGETGPERWCELDDAFALCCEGEEQSPVNITSSTPSTKPVLAIHYEEKKPVLSTQNNGHTIMTTYEVQHYIELDGKRYNLVQFHFHYLSEHLINGKQYPMELHLVHRSDDGKLAVLGVFIEEGKQTRLSKKPGKIYPTQRATHTVRRALWI